MKPEANEQIIILKFCQLRNIPVAATPNETPAQDIVGRTEQGKPIWKPRFKTAREAKAKGASKGFPDLTIIAPCGDGASRVIFIELKDPALRPKKLKPLRGINGVFQIQNYLFSELNWQDKKGNEKKTLAGVKREQIFWLRDLDAAREVGAYVCYGAEEAIIILDWLSKKTDF
jgi:hypothetical protein